MVSWSYFPETYLQVPQQKAVHVRRKRHKKSEQGHPIFHWGAHEDRTERNVILQRPDERKDRLVGGRDPFVTLQEDGRVYSRQDFTRFGRSTSQIISTVSSETDFGRRSLDAPIL